MDTGTRAFAAAYAMVVDRCRKTFLGITAAAVWAALCVAAPVTASEPAGGETTVRAAYSSLERALLKNDAAALSDILAANFQATRVDGTMQDRSSFIKDQIEPTKGVTIASIVIEVKELTLHGQAATVEAIYRYAGRYAASGASKPLTAVMHVTDRWTLKGHAWRLWASAGHDALTYVDGKLVESQYEELEPAAAALAELKSRAISIPTLALNADPQQLAAIGTAIGNARIVGLGEGSHGSSEFFAFKNRLFKYLVERKGFTVFAMEAAWGSGLYVDRYIKTGRGSARQAVTSLGFWTWNTPEVVDLVQWMREYNARPGKHPTLSFAGVDMQDPTGAIGYLVSYLRAHAVGPDRGAQAVLHCAQLTMPPRNSSTDEGCRSAVAAIGVRLAALQGAGNVAVAQQAVRTILQYLDSRGPSTGATMVDRRDRDMADNVGWLASVRYPREKIALWAHNGHIDAGRELSYRPMGSYLRSRFGPDYYAIGQTFGSGTVRAIVTGHGLQTVGVPPHAADTTAALFSPLHQTAFLDLRGLTAGSSLQTYFSGYHGVEEIGALIDPQHPEYQRIPMVIPNSFDGFVYVPTSTAATDGVVTSNLHRDVTAGAVTWRISGGGFDDVTVQTTNNEAALLDRDDLDAMLNAIVRLFDASEYLGRTVRVSGEIRRDDLYGWAIPEAQAVTSTGSLVYASFGKNSTWAQGETWTPFNLTLAVPANATLIEAGMAVLGVGTAHLRNLTIAPAPLSSSGR